MKNWWLILVVLLSFVACSEKEEQPLAPIYADAFYEPDFIPYLMLKHGVDTIKEVINGTVQRIHTFNKRTNTYRRKGSMFGGENLTDLHIIVFCDSMIMYEMKRGWDWAEHFRYVYNRNQDTILKIEEGNNFTITDNDSIVIFSIKGEKELKKHSAIPDTSISKKYFFRNGKIINVKRKYLSVDYTYDSLNRIKEYFEKRDDEEGSKKFSYTKANYFWKDNKLDYITFEERVFWISSKPDFRKIYFKNSLPFRLELFNIDSSNYYHFADYQIIRNPKKQ